MSSNTITPTTSSTSTTTTNSSNTTKSYKSYNSSTTTNITTISGIDIETSAIYIHIISALIGVVVFYFVPYLANHVNKPITAVILNVIPNDLMLGFFIVEDEFEEYLLASVFSPIFNVIDNIISYSIYVYGKSTPSIALWSNILLWIFVVILSYFIL